MPRRGPENAWLEILVGGARQAVYDARTGRRSVVRFFVTGYWRLIVERKKALLVAFVLLFGSAALAALWGIHDPAAATGVVPQQFRPALQPGHPWHDMSPSQQTAFTTEVFTNNIQVTLVAFAGGITGGIATALALLYNGLQIGVIGGLMGQAGNASASSTSSRRTRPRAFLHPPRRGSRLSLGWSIISLVLPTRRASLQHEARRRCFGRRTAPWLVVAGIVEGNRANLAESGLGAIIGTGVGLGVVFCGLVV